MCFVLFTVDVLGFDFFFLPGGCGWICFVLCLADGCGCWCLFVFFLGSVVWRSVVLGLFVLPGGCGWICFVLLVPFPVVAVGVCVLSFSRWMCWGLISFSFPVDVVGYVLFCAWRMGVVAGVFLSFSWALSCGGVWF